ncbi:purine nucleosidase domain protein [Mycobacterium kansasii]|uniref:Purine nucleosidase domain protein n=1 Tax=Mycobacterium kansasii TaxID=1768 RepID=A0A1V3WMP6_MYCKA|nr:purine nucleosidase domain protein [Mycobacterium kansasii]
MKPVFVDVDTGVDDALALLYLLASPRRSWWASPRRAETLRYNRFAKTTWACSSCAELPAYRCPRVPAQP